MEPQDKLIVKVAKGYLMKKVLPALALSTGMAGCADLPTGAPDAAQTAYVSSAANEQGDMARVSAQELQNEILQSLEDKSLGGDDIAALRSRAANRFRKILEPFYSQYDKLSGKEKERFGRTLSKVESDVKKVEQSTLDILYDRYLDVRTGTPEQAAALRQRYDTIKRTRGALKGKGV